MSASQTTATPLGTSIKVAYDGALRNVNLTAAEQASWDDFETKIRTLFQIPDSFKITVNYIDSDGDTIMLDSDQELLDLFRTADSRPSKLNVVGIDPDTASGSKPSSDKGKARQENPSDKHPFEEFMDKMDPMVSELNEELKKSNIGPILERIATEAHKQFSSGSFSMPSHCGGSKSSCKRPSCGSSDSTRDPIAEAFHKRRFYGGCHPYHAFRQAAVQKQEYPPRWSTVVCDGCNAKGFAGARHMCQTCDDFDLCGDCFAKAKTIHNAEHEFVVVKHPAEKKEDEMVEAVWGMGFEVEEERTRDLIRRYEGNLDRVVEVLKQNSVDGYDIIA
ncbi:hypothetical protein HDU98_006741 [Podochytrium sp. JEL0797]|nr:hypothetical protein HDU98_006741 [Podochytrium sp. JEL0797]